MEDEDYVEPTCSAENDDSHSEAIKDDKVNFLAVKLDASVVQAEFMCNLSLKPLHLLQTPMLATCCGLSACYDCIKSLLAQNFNCCPICGRDGTPKFAHNKWLHQLLEAELPKDTEKLTDA